MAASATLYENVVWISDPDNPLIVIQSGSGGTVGGGGQRLTAKTTDGAVRSYGNGRQRSVSGASTVASYTLALIALTQAESDQIDAWRKAGTTLLFRDTYGQRAFGTILSTSLYFRPLTVAMAAQPTGHLGTYPANGPYIDVGFVINEVTMPDGS